MIPAYGMVSLTQNPSTGNGQIPGCSFIFSGGAGGVIFERERILAPIWIPFRAIHHTTTIPRVHQPAYLQYIGV